MRFLSNCLCNYSQIGLFDTKTYRNKVQRLSPTFCNGTAVCPVICSCLGKIFSALHLLKPQPPHLSTLVTFQMFVSIVDLRELPPKTCSFQNQNIAKHLKIHQIYQLLSAHFEVFPQKVGPTWGCGASTSVRAFESGPSFQSEAPAQPRDGRSQICFRCHEMMRKIHENWRWKTCFETIEIYFGVR